MSAGPETYEARRAVLVARAAAQREALARQLAPLGRLQGGLERLRTMKAQWPAIGVGAGLGLAALLLALPGGRSPWIRGGIALFHLASSVKRLFSRP